MNGIDLFAGARGWDVAARHLGWHMDGVENWKPANDTATAAGFTTVHEDVRTFHAEPGQYDLLIGSPSCKRYSAAGNGHGRRAVDAVLSCIRPGITTAEAQKIIGDEDAALVIEPLRIIMECRPTFIALEQAIAVLPIWQAHARVLEEMGYSVVTGILNAEQYGVPQTRRRAILVARRDGPSAFLPTPTHSRYYSTDPTRLDNGVKSWVSMAEALDWNQAITSKADRFKIHASKRMGSGMVERHGPRPDRSVDLPSFTIRAEAGGMEPGGFRWTEQDGTLIRKVTPEEAACLQTFPVGYPFQGGKSQVMTQIGNAVPPLLAEAILAQFTT